MIVYFSCSRVEPYHDIISTMIYYEQIDDFRNALRVVDSARQKASREGKWVYEGMKTSFYIWSTDDKPVRLTQEMIDEILKGEK